MKFSLVNRILLILLALALTNWLQAQSSATPHAFGLPRLKSSANPNGAAPLAAGKASVDDLLAVGQAGVNRGKRNHTDYLSVEPGKVWSHPLRGAGGSSVSFLVIGSQSTVVQIGGARLGLTGSPADNTLQLMYDDSSAGAPEWRSLGLYLPVSPYAGQSLSALPVITVQLSADAKSWAVFAGTRLVAYELPVLPGADRTFSVKAGVSGAWICGLVQADENPLYEDSNGNGIDDAFEKQQRGGAVLPTNAPPEERRGLARQWITAQRTEPVAAMSYNRPLPDIR